MKNNIILASIVTGALTLSIGCKKEETTSAAETQSILPGTIVVDLAKMDPGNLRDNIYCFAKREGSNVTFSLLVAKGAESIAVEDRSWFWNHQVPMTFELERIEGDKKEQLHMGVTGTTNSLPRQVNSRAGKAVYVGKDKELEWYNWVGKAVNFLHPDNIYSHDHWAVIRRGKIYVFEKQEDNSLIEYTGSCTKDKSDLE